jgi:hypothetical protein
VGSAGCNQADLGRVLDDSDLPQGVLGGQGRNSIHLSLRDGEEESVVLSAEEREVQALISERAESTGSED